MPGHTWALIGATAVVVTTSTAVIGAEWKRRAVTPWPWRALERLGMALWAITAAMVGIGSSPPAITLAPIGLVAVGMFGIAAARSGLAILLQWPVLVALATVPVVTAVLGVLPETRDLVTMGDSSWSPGPVLVFTAIWLAVALAGGSLLEIGAARQAVGPLRTDIVLHGILTIALLVVVAVALWSPYRPHLIWAPIIITMTATISAPWIGGRTDLMHAPTSSVVDVVSDALAVVGSGGTVIDTNKAGSKAFLMEPDRSGGLLRRRLLDPNLLPALEGDGERTLTTRAGTVLQVRTATVLENGKTIATILSARDITEVERLKVKLVDLAARDALTGLYNRRNLGSQLASMTWTGEGAHSPVSVALVDLDHLKVLNDKFGHQMGDKAIVGVAEVLAESASPEDLVFRVGGDEFLVAMPDTDSEMAELRAQQWRVAVGRLDLGPDTPRVTLSIGVAPLEAGMSVAAFISAADQALYAAKAAGRNRVRVRTPARGPIGGRP